MLALNDTSTLLGTPSDTRWQLADLDPFDRILVTTDGTVTTLLEACAAEPIVTRTVRHAGPAAPARLAATGGRWWQPNEHLLCLAPDERLVARRVTLDGAHSAVTYVAAESLVAVDRLPEPIAIDLQRTDASLGRLLAAGRLESRRDIVEIVPVPAGAAADQFHLGPSVLLVRRRYTILIGSRPVAAVTEWLDPGRLAAASRAA